MSMHEVTIAEQEAHDAHEAEWGGFNDFPPNWREVDPYEFAYSQASGKVITKTEFRQMWHRKDDRKIDRSKGMLAARLFYAGDNTGWAMTTDFWAGYNSVKKEMVSDDKPPVRYFLFGCEHENDPDQTRQIGTYAHEYVCAKCGRHEVIDSSG